jgi:hypothetical protein
MPLSILDTDMLSEVLKQQNLGAGKKAAYLQERFKFKLAPL